MTTIPKELQDKIVDLENYKKIKKIGQGNYGKVYLIQNKETGIKYAAKISKYPYDPSISLNLGKKSDTDDLFTPDSSQLPDDADELSEENEPLSDSEDQDSQQYDDIYFNFDEFLIMAKFQYPCLLGVEGISLTNFKKEPYPTIILKHMQNDTVASFFSSIYKTNTKIYIILLGIAIGMRHLHSNIIVHRDLKPENVLLDDNFYPYIADFGFSKQGLTSSFLFKSILGTPLYVAPEILANKHYSLSVDVFSFSILAYRLLANRQPYDNRYLNGNFQTNVVRNKLRPNTKYIKSETVKNFLKKCWSKKPNDRPTFDQIIIEMTDKKFYEDYDIIVSEALEYLSLFGDEFDEIKKKFISENPAVTFEKLTSSGRKIATDDDDYVDNVDDDDNDNDNDNGNESIDSEAVRIERNRLCLSEKDLKIILDVVNVDANAFLHWAEMYNPDENAEDEKRKSVVDDLVRCTKYERRIVEIIYDFTHPKNKDDDVQVMMVGAASLANELIE